jgi:hypothetical protein
MTKRAPFKQSDVTRLIRGAIAAGLPVGSFKIVVEEGRLALLPVAANEPSDPYAESAKRIRKAFGRD